MQNFPLPHVSLLRLSSQTSLRKKKFHSLSNILSEPYLSQKSGPDPVFLSFNYCQVRWKKKRKKERVTKNEEQKKTAASDPPIRLEDHIGSEEPVHVVAKNIRKGISRICDGSKRKADFRRFNRYRIYRAVGLTHDHDGDEDGLRKQGSTYVTPLTRLQHKSTMPRGLEDRKRFPFSHSLHYDCFWGPPQTQVEPNKTQCQVTFSLRDMPFSPRQEDFVRAVVGDERLDKHKDLVCIEANHFDQLNHNAAFLGDALENLIKETQNF